MYTGFSFGLLCSYCFQHIYENTLRPRNDGPLTGTLHTFNQAQFIPNPASRSIYSSASSVFVYLSRILVLRCLPVWLLFLLLFYVYLVARVD